jgi:hypothetical protein
LRDQSLAAQERLLRLAHDFLEETRAEHAKAAADGVDLLPRIRTVHDRPGHASPEFRTLAVPIPPHAEGASPTVLSAAIARFAAERPPNCILLTLDVIGTDENGEAQPLLIAEARDRVGSRLFFVQPFRVEDAKVVWDEPMEGGWRDPGGEEMILDAAFGGVKG